MRTTISLDGEQARLLRYLALRQQCSLDEVVQQALGEHLSKHGLQPGFGVREPARQASDEEWRSGFDEAVQRIRTSVDPGWSPEEIEADITAASEELRQERLARKPDARV